LKVFEGIIRVVFEGKSREELGCLMGEFRSGKKAQFKVAFTSP
jgi:hypothetical protein